MNPEWFLLNLRDIDKAAVVLLVAGSAGDESFVSAVIVGIR